MDGAYAPPAEKRCSTCGEVKPLSEFYRNRGHKDGLSYVCKPCSNIASAAWRAANPQRAKELERRHTPKKLAYMKVKYVLLKAEVLERYGTCCACCGSTENLGIDHINGDGYEHREELFGNGRANSLGFYRWLIGNNFPPGFQTLCRPCNSSKSRDGSCKMHSGPHPSHLTTRELRGRISGCVDAANRGDPTVITCFGKPRAVLVSYNEWIALQVSGHRRQRTARTAVPQGNEVARLF